MPYIRVWAVPIFKALKPKLIRINSPMAAALKDQYGPDVPRTIGDMVQAVYPVFKHATFLDDALRGYDDLALMPPGKHIAQVLQQHLPADYPQALAILLASCEQSHQRDIGQSLASFLFLPHTLFVSLFGLGHFDLSMQAQHALTQRFTAEFSIRAFLDHHPLATLAQLKKWTQDPSPHVRRLVSEGTRPRLPWAGRLRQFQKDPTPVLALLECLKDDPALYVRRSVANNLNDIGKHDPDILAQTALEWRQDASQERCWIVGHALRSAVKRGESAALDALGYGAAVLVALQNALMHSQRIQAGKAVTVSVEVLNPGAQALELLIDLAVHCVKANGKTRPKVFKLKALRLPAGGSVRLRKVVSLKEMTTRKHHAGVHAMALLVNGRARALGEFGLLKR